MSYLSFLSSHRLHSSHRPWIDPLAVQLGILLHELPNEKPAPPLDLSIAPLAIGEAPVGPTADAADATGALEAA